jgi:hypothetical protein
VTGAPASASRPEASEFPPQPRYAARWGPLTLSLNEATLTAAARRLIGEIPELEDLTVHASPGELSISIVVRRFGVPLSARTALSQIRFKEGFLACVLDRVEALSFIPIPDAILRFLVKKAPPGLMTYDAADRILVVDVTPWTPSGLDLTLDRAEFGHGEVTLFFRAGCFDLGRILGR